MQKINKTQPLQPFNPHFRMVDLLVVVDYRVVLTRPFTEWEIFGSLIDGKRVAVSSVDVAFENTV